MTDTEREALCARIDELCAENERLHADQAHWELGNCPQCPNIVSLQEKMDENAKLLELVRGMYKFMEIAEALDAHIHLTPDERCSFAARIAELGIEVTA